MDVATKTITVRVDEDTKPQYEFHRMIKAKLEESEAIAADPNAKRYTHEEIFAPLRERFGYEKGEENP
jgi:hypothetical protein